jgi:copper(I)-binding protein
MLFLGGITAAAVPHIVSAQSASPDGPTRSVNSSALLIERPWIRATPGGAKVAAGYLRITNRGAEAERLIGASIPLAERGEVHEMARDGGEVKMRTVEGGIEIQSGQTVELKPGGHHLMFMGLSSGAKEGAAVRGSLMFMKAGNINVTFRVTGIGAQTSGGEHRP